MKWAMEAERRPVRAASVARECNSKSAARKDYVSNECGDRDDQSLSRFNKRVAAL